MIGIDTNIIVRYLTQDDPVQSRIVNRMLEAAARSGKRFWVSQITLCEMVWVLEGNPYKTPKKEIINVIASLLDLKQLKIEGEDTVFEALAVYKKHPKADFADSLISRGNRNQGCLYTLTFDKQAAKTENFKLLRA
jgi:predicted nucleic-acid-binding protein